MTRRKNAKGKSSQREKFNQSKEVRAIARERVVQLDPRVGLHPALKSLTESWQARDLAIVQGIGLKGVLFVDAGNAYSAEDGITLDETRYAAGLGARWLSPVGPLRI